jgi:type I site-specific restriction-modification system R (restriction) subunit
LDQLKAIDINSVLHQVRVDFGRRELRRLLIGDPKKGDFGLIGDIILDACVGSVESVINNKSLSKQTKQNKGTFAHTLLEAEVKQLNLWLQSNPVTKAYQIQAEVSRDSNGGPAKRGAAGSFRLDVTVFYNGRPAVAFDLKTGKKAQAGIGTGGISNSKRLEYERRFRTRVFTIGVAIP